MKSNTKIYLIALLPLLTSLTATAEEIGKAKDSNTTTHSAAIPSAESKSRKTSWRASEIFGTNVKNAKDETVGEVEDLIVDWSSREVIAVVISTGGFLGIADGLSSVSLTSLIYDPNDKVFRTSLSKMELEKQPRFTSQTWPDYNKEEVISSLRAARDKIGGDVNAPDNSAQNEKDMKNTVTPLDQGNSEGDLKLTKDIRSAVVDSELSFNAKNIKIVTNGGKVTLRGVVESAAEHQAILKIVHAHADASKVTDQLKAK